MKIEYANYDISNNDAELKASITEALTYPISTISVLPPYVKLAKSIINGAVNLSTAIDYPLGVMDSKTRLESVDLAIKSGANQIDLLCPINLICNRKYDKFKEDIKNNLELCSQNNIELRYILEYRVYSYELMYKVAQVLSSAGIDTIFPSTGYLLDDIHDNILAAGLVNQKVTKVRIICNGNIWNDKHIELISKTKPYGIKVNSLHCLNLIDKNMSKLI